MSPVPFHISGRLDILPVRLLEFAVVVAAVAAAVAAVVAAVTMACEA